MIYTKGERAIVINLIRVMRDMFQHISVLTLKLNEYDPLIRV